MGLLDFQIADKIWAGFRGKMLRATLWKNPGAPSTVLDMRGQPIERVVQTYSCQGFVDGGNDYFRARGWIPESDANVCIFGSALPRNIAPWKDDKINIPANSGTWWQIRKIQSDPATALWVCQSFVCRSPYA